MTNLENLKQDILSADELSLLKLVSIIQLSHDFRRGNIKILGMVDNETILISIAEVEGIEINAKVLIQFDEYQNRIRIFGKLVTEVKYYNLDALLPSINEINSKYNMNKYYIDKHDKDISTGNAFIISEYEIYLTKYLSKIDFIYQIRKFAAMLVVVARNENIIR